jgi:hypothetical protein
MHVRDNATYDVGVPLGTIDAIVRQESLEVIMLGIAINWPRSTAAPETNGTRTHRHGIQGNPLRFQT